VSDNLAALRAAFDGTALPPTEPTLGYHTLAAARTALNEALGQLNLVAKQPELTSAHAKQLAACSASLRRAAHNLETLAAGVEDHVANGVSIWTGRPGSEQPVLL
jgi:hypothetical protein